MTFALSTCDCVTSGTVTVSFVVDASLTGVGGVTSSACTIPAPVDRVATAKPIIIFA
ncbi:hypothetical protein [Streptococcus uberis]